MGVICYLDCPRSGGDGVQASACAAVAVLVRVFCKLGLANWDAAATGCGARRLGRRGRRAAGPRLHGRCCRARSKGLGSTSRRATRGRGIQTTRSSADSSDDVVKNESGSERTSPQFTLVPAGAAARRRRTDLAGRAAGCGGRRRIGCIPAYDYARPRARGRERPHQYRAAASESSLETGGRVGPT